MNRRMASKAERVRWAEALADGRVVKYHGGQTFVSYPTVALRDVEIAIAREAGFEAEIVIVPAVPR